MNDDAKGKEGRRWEEGTQRHVLATPLANEMTSITQWCRKSQWTIVGMAGVGAFFIFLFLDGVHLQFVVPVRRVCGDNELALSL